MACSHSQWNTPFVTVAKILCCDTYCGRPRFHEYKYLEYLFERNPRKPRPYSPLSNYYSNLHVTTYCSEPSPNIVPNFPLFLALPSPISSVSYSRSLFPVLSMRTGGRLAFVLSLLTAIQGAPRRPHQLLSYHHPEPSPRPRLRIPPVGPVCYAQSSPMRVRMTMTGDLLDIWHPLLCKIGYRRRCGDLLCGVPGRRSLYQIQKQN